MKISNLKKYQVNKTQLKDVTGGACYVTWSNNGKCDIADTNTRQDIMCNVDDGNVRVGQYIYGCG